MRTCQRPCGSGAHPRDRAIAASLNPKYEYGKQKELANAKPVREQCLLPRQRPAPFLVPCRALQASLPGLTPRPPRCPSQSSPVAVPAKDRALSKSGTGSRSSSGRTVSGKPSTPGQTHGHKGSLLFKPLAEVQSS